MFEQYNTHNIKSPITKPLEKRPLVFGISEMSQIFLTENAKRFLKGII